MILEKVLTVSYRERERVHGGQNKSKFACLVASHHEVTEANMVVETYLASWYTSHCKLLK